MLKITFNPLLLLLFTASILISSCDKRRVFEENQKIPNSTWAIGDEMRFEVDIKDTTAFYNLFINLRNTGEYQYSNLYVFIDIHSPKGNTQRDTIECILANKTGKWLGSGIGDIYDNRILFKRDIRFPVSGTYTFVFEHAMRDQYLEHIIDAGLRVERSS